MTERTVLVDVYNGVGQLTLNRPAELNALSLEMIQRMSQQLTAWADDPQIRIVVLRGTGEKAFCAGGDIRGLYESYLAKSDFYVTFFEQEYALDVLLHAYPKPVLALMNGFVLGGGMGLAQAASHRVITERTKMGMPETGIGYFPDVGASYFLPRLEGYLGQYLGVTGVHIRAADALYCGLADHCIDSDKVAAFEDALGTLEWSDAPARNLDTLLETFATQTLEASELSTLRPAIDQHFSHLDMLAIRVSLADEGRDAYQEWAHKTLDIIDQKSPLAMCLTLELLRQGHRLGLEECFALELHLDKQWFADGDIMEGVRALIIDKDKTPRWRHTALEDVIEHDVARFFTHFAPLDAAYGRPA